MDSTQNLAVMFLAMMASGLLSSMNIWANSWDDVRISLNDWYMSFLMSGWMFLFMGLFYRSKLQIILGIIIVVISLYLIRTQAFVGYEQYLKAMIPHHSMATFMSKKLLDKGINSEFAKNIIDGQSKEIEWMKHQNRQPPT